MPYLHAIQTEFSETDQGSHITATTSGKWVAVPSPHDFADYHDKAAMALIAEQGWWGRWSRGFLSDKQGWVYVWLDDPPSEHPLTITIE